MIAPRVSIGRMMLMIVPVAVGCAALCRPTRLGASLVFAAVFAILTVKALGAVFGEAGRRPSRAGFAVAGWLCLLLHFSTLFDLPNGVHDAWGTVAPTTPVRFVLDLLYPRIVPGARALLLPPTIPMPPPPIAPAPVPLPFDATPRGPSDIPPEPIAPPKVNSPPVVPPLPPAPVGPTLRPVMSPVAQPAPPSLWDRWVAIDLGGPDDIAPRSCSFLTIGYCLATLLAAGLGSLVAGYHAAKRLKTSPEGKRP